MQGVNNPNRELLDAEALCRQLAPEGSVYVLLADHPSELFPDDMFDDLFPSSLGRPSIPAGVMASAVILKELEGLSDRQAAEALRCDIRWKVACGLALDDEGVHYTVFTYWRRRLNRSQAPNRIADAVRQVVDATGVLSGKRRRALGSTLLDDAVATQDTVTITPSRAATFGARCRGCPIRERCTSATGGRTFRIGDHDQLLAQVRAQWRARDNLDDYRQYRPMVERSISWIVTNGHRRVRYRGGRPNRAQLALRIAAINLRRLVNLGLDHNGHVWAVA